MLYIVCLCLSHLHKCLRFQNHTSNSPVLFGSLSSTILSICPAHGSLLLVRLSLLSSSAFMFVPLKLKFRKYPSINYQELTRSLCIFPV